MVWYNFKEFIDLEDRLRNHPNPLSDRLNLNGFCFICRKLKDKIFILKVLSELGTFCTAQYIIN